MMLFLFAEKEGKYYIYFPSFFGIFNIRNVVYSKLLTDKCTYNLKNTTVRALKKKGTISYEIYGCIQTLELTFQD
ncbi:hypothetical protein CN425_09570 [Bacillus cereus]|uniref:Uncharacterized protein n=1 Tax=Bacillus cereus TaxID=1396 RepID=A0A2A8PYF5_BACCE|nr:hypothetical protein ICU_02194 [Bacillus cereus BAG2X1-1]EJS76810.1 hypothetical protein ICY_02033 [Bacillus cereus BAG2X1-3]PEA09763.1 hypothetical protein CON38_11990 [Bacillus cereus]PEW03130.1 hypothetical protein CN425_09570 [Bacillus cereus]PFI15434.1 hypothetical protein COI75_25960 [Bacillus cereus]